MNKAGEYVPALFTEDAKKALVELRSEHHEKSEPQKTGRKKFCTTFGSGGVSFGKCMEASFLAPGSRCDLRRPLSAEGFAEA